MMREYTVKKYWDHVHNKKRLMVISGKNEIVQLLNNYIPIAKEGQACFEIGCCPCGFLSYVGIKKKYIINGIDYSEGINERMQKWLESLPLQIGKVERGDFFKNRPVDKYDFVYSFGFIEHFKDYQKVILMHDRYVKQGGYLMITTPNFRGGVQYMLHKWLDNQNLKRHNVDSMRPEKWKQLLEDKDYEILYCGYVGGFSFWIEDRLDSVLKKKSMDVINFVSERLSEKTVPSSQVYSPHCGIIARKRGN